MRLLLDTHVLVWLIGDPARIPAAVRGHIAAPESDVFVSAASAWEIAIKSKSGKIAFDAEFLTRFDDRVRLLGFTPLPISSAHAVAGARLSGVHKDPFDRLLGGQAVTEGLTLATADPLIAGLGVRVVW